MFIFLRQNPFYMACGSCGQRKKATYSPPAAQGRTTQQIILAQIANQNKMHQQATNQLLKARRVYR